MESKPPLLYPKIELLVMEDSFSTKKLTFENVNYFLHSGYLIIERYNDNYDKICDVFNLKDVKSYKLHTI